MTLQARMSASDNRLYNPGRDVAHNFKQVMEEVAKRLEDKNSWKELSEVLKRENVTDKDLGDACAAYCRYLVDSANLPQLSTQWTTPGFLKRSQRHKLLLWL
jgi:hypothetical protein